MCIPKLSDDSGFFELGFHLLGGFFVLEGLRLSRALGFFALVVRLNNIVKNVLL